VGRKFVPYRQDCKIASTARIPKGETMTTAPHRIGAPQPLAQHIGQMVAVYQAGLAGAAAAGRPDFPWDPSLDISGLNQPEPAQVAAEVAKRMDATMAGLHRWQTHPYRRPPCSAPLIWQSGAAKLFDYTAPETPANAPAVMVLPSLVNRAYVLDLMPGCSAMARLAGAGLRPFMLDWGAPGPAEAAFDIDDYINLGRAALAQTGPATVLGYCMGGTLAAGLAARYPGQINGLVTLGAPWDFAAGGGMRAQLRLAFGQHNGVAAETALTALAASYGHIPADVFQSLFAILNPLAFARKFRKFATLPDESKAGALFVAVEDWLADGIAMAAPAARTLLLDWHLHNTPAAGAWHINAKPVQAANIRCPTLVVAGQHDSIAPAEGALALAKAVPDAQHRLAPTGHVGLITSDRVAPPIWRDIGQFIRDANSSAT